MAVKTPGFRCSQVASGFPKRSGEKKSKGGQVESPGEKAGVSPDTERSKEWLWVRG